VRDAVAFRGNAARGDADARQQDFGTTRTAISVHVGCSKSDSGDHLQSRRAPIDNCDFGCASPSGVSRLSRLGGMRDGSVFTAVMRSVHKFSYGHKFERSAATPVVA
jgi:hypothetical protein